MKPQRLRLKARGKLLELNNTQFEKMTRGYDPRPKGVVTRNKHRQVPRAKIGK